MRLLTGATIIDGSGNTPVRGHCLLVQDDLIVAMGPEPTLDLPSKGVERLDLLGSTLMPGFIDCHVHLSWTGGPLAETGSESTPGDQARRAIPENAQRTLEAGFTTVQDLGGANEIIFPLRDVIASGRIEGPHIIAAGASIAAPRGDGTSCGPGFAVEVQDRADLIHAVRRQIRNGANVIKIMVSRSASSPQFRETPAFNVNELRQAVEVAHRAGLRVCAHAHTLPSAIETAVLAGIDSIEHGAPIVDRVLRIMADQGTFLVPTLSVGLNVPPRGAASNLPFSLRVIEWMRRLDEQTRDTVRRAHRFGVRIALGTDSGAPRLSHGANAREFGLLVECGLSPMDAILAGTRQASINVGRAVEVGTIEVGKRADLVAVRQNPLQNISTLADQEDILFVMKAGEILVDRRSRQAHNEPRGSRMRTKE